MGQEGDKLLSGPAEEGGCLGSLWGCGGHVGSCQPAALVFLLSSVLPPQWAGTLSPIVLPWPLHVQMNR